MSKLVVGGLALMLVLGASLAQAKDHKGGGGGSGSHSCQQESFERCMDKCMSKGGRGKSSTNVVKCAKHCDKKKC